MASMVACRPACSMAVRAGPAASCARTAVSGSGKLNGDGTSPARCGISPAAATSSSSLPGPLSANGPLALAGGGGSSAQLAQRGDRVGGVLHRVERGDRVERVVRVRQRLQLALAQV